MVLVLFLFGIFSGIVSFFFLSKNKGAAVLFFCSLACLMLVSMGSVANYFIEKLQISFENHEIPSWREKNIIIVLGAGTVKDMDRSKVLPPIFSYSRIVKGAELYHACRRVSRSCTLLISGGDPLHHGESEAAVYAKVLTTLKVPKEDLLLEEQSLNTFDNAKYTQELLKRADHPSDGLILVTSGTHMRRSLLYFNFFGMHPEACASDTLKGLKKIWPLSYNLALIDIVLHEYMGILRFKLYNLLGLNRRNPISA